MIENKICIDKNDAEDFAEYLSLILKHPEILDEAIIIVACIFFGLYINYTNQQFIEKKRIVQYALDLNWDIPENYTMNIDDFTDKYIRDKVYLIEWGHNWYEFGVSLIHNEYGWRNKSVNLRFNIETGEKETSWLIY